MVFSPRIYWAGRNEGSPTNSFFSDLKDIEKSFSIKEMYNLLPDKYKGKIHWVFNENYFSSTKINLGKGDVKIVRK